MNLTQNQKRDLNDIVGRLKKAETFINNPKITVMQDFGSTGKDEINKDVGSDLVYLYRAINLLESFIEKH